MKKIIIVGFVTCCFLLMGTSIYAKSEYVLHSMDWFKSRFAIIADHASKEMKQELSSISEAAEIQEEQSTKNAEKSLDNTVTSLTTNVNGKLQKYKSDYKQQIVETQESLLESEWAVEEEVQKLIDEIESNLLDVLEDILTE